MRQVLTLVVKLQLGIVQQQLLDDTITAFVSACNWINQNVNPKLINQKSIQAVCYQDVKQQFELTANHVVRSCDRVATNYLTAQQKGKKSQYFKPTSLDCNARACRFSSPFLIAILAVVLFLILLNCKEPTYPCEIVTPSLYLSGVCF